MVARLPVHQTGFPRAKKTAATDEVAAALK